MDLLRTPGYAALGTGDPRAALRLALTRAEPIHLLRTGVVVPPMSGKQLALIEIDLRSRRVRARSGIR